MHYTNKKEFFNEIPTPTEWLDNGFSLSLEENQQKVFRNL